MPTIGEQLKQAREARKLTIKQAEAGTHVRAYYLLAMETDDFSDMPSITQARGFLRLYAEFLKLNADELITMPGDKTLPAAAVIAPPVLTAPPAAATPKARASEPPEPVILKEDAKPIIPGPPLPSQTIFNEIGGLLRERRELISLTMEEIERHTHIRKHNLESIEGGRFQELPSPVQARGILNTYAGFLDMDTDATLLRYADALQAARLERQPDEAGRSSMPRNRSSILPPWLRRFLSPDLIFGGGMILTLLALSIWGAARIFSNGATAQTTPTQGPSISDVLLETPIPGAGATQVDIIPTSVDDIGSITIATIDPALVTPTDTVQPTVSSAVKVLVIVLERTFLRVSVDGEVKQDGRVSVGAALTFDGNERIEVLTGSGSAVQIVFNQADLGVLGSYGEVVNRIYTINGVATPTPTASPTPSITPIPSITPKPSATLRPSLTPRPSSTPRPSPTQKP